MLFLWSQKQVFMLHAIDKLKFKLSKEVKKGDFMNETGFGMSTTIVK